VKIETLEQARRAAFMGAYRGLRHQGWKRAYHEGVCSTRLRAADGTVMCCAVGWLAPDASIGWTPECARLVELPSPEKLAAPLADWFVNANSSDRIAFHNFLDLLRSAHDYAKDPEHMLLAFETIRAQNNWPIPS
jgi:hypothetical protein